MLAVDRQDGHLVLSAQTVYQFARHYHRLLIGQGDRLTSTYSSYSRSQTCKTHHGREHHVHLVALDHLTESLGTSINGYRQVSQRRAECFVVLLIGNDHCRRHELPRLFGQQLPTVGSGKHTSLEAVGMLSNDLQGLRAYRTGGTEDGYLFFSFFALHIWFCLLRLSGGGVAAGLRQSHNIHDLSVEV